jgi:hypothetical protein
MGKEIPFGRDETELAATELFHGEEREGPETAEKSESEEDKTAVEVPPGAKFAPETSEQFAEAAEVLRKTDRVTAEIYDTLISEAGSLVEIQRIVKDLNSLLEIREARPCEPPCKHLDSLGSESLKGVNKVFILRMVERGKILKSVYKPARGEEDRTARAGVEAGSFHRREWLACMVDRALGLGIVPPTVLRREDDGIGSVQAWVPEAMPAGLVPERQPDQEDLVKLALFDYLIGSQDRHKNNYLIDRNGKLKAIDNGVSFGTSLRNDEGREIVPVLETKSRPLEKIKDIDADIQSPIIEAHLKKLLDSSAKKEALKRAFDVALGEDSTEVWEAFVRRAEEVLKKRQLPKDHDFKIAIARINYSHTQEYLGILKRGKEKMEEAA